MQLQIRKKDDRIVGYADSGLIADDHFDIVDVTEEIDEETILSCRYQNGQILFDQSFDEQRQEEERQREGEIEGQLLFQSLQKNMILNQANDEQAYVMRYLYDVFNPNSVFYREGDRLRYLDRFYRVLQDHHSQSDWLPDRATSLYVEVPDPKEQWPEWQQPINAETAYPIGAQVTHHGKKYLSLIESNTTEPGTNDLWWQEV